MCRWLAYSGPSIPLDAILFKPDNSLIRQSLSARRSRSVTNGDGFGVGWYSDHPHPGLFRDIHPAWNDENLRNLAEQIRANLFFSHVRASTGAPTARANCHPFRHGEWLFMHNGQIGGFNRIRRDLAFAVSPELYPQIVGSTDSELFFHLAIGEGLLDDPLGALGRATRLVEDMADAAGVDEPFMLTAAATDGRTIYAVRYGSGGDAPTLFFGHKLPAVEQTRDGIFRDLAGDEAAVIVLSEPLDDAESDWTEVPPGHAVIAAENRAYTVPFEAR